ncbi:MAG TPA: NADH-quinone oxidoreductase subunit NuoE [Longilinea sp.]|nr:NADH-quinone oxidoreductase subunit NuoE [Longilinea sp.]
MAVETQEKKVTKDVVRTAAERHGTDRAELIPILNDINQELGYLPAEALEEVSRLLRVPQSQLFSVASFYQMLSTKPRGRHVIQFCESAPCHVVGGRQVWQALLDELKVEPGETTPDGKWSLITVSCLGVCAVGPVMLVDGEIIGNLTPEQIPNILSRYH